MKHSVAGRATGFTTQLRLTHSRKQRNKLITAQSEIILKIKPGNRGDMLKIHVTWQFFKASGPQSQFFEKKNPVFRYGLGVCVDQT